MPMQGQKGAMGSLPETVDIDCASSSGSTAMSCQLCWNILRSQSETHLASFGLPPSTDSLIHLQQNWPVSSSVECSGSSSSPPDNDLPEWKLGNGLPSSAGFSNGLFQHPENQPECANTGDFASGGIDASHLQIQRSNFGCDPPTLSLKRGHNSDKSPILCPTDQVADVSGNSRVMHDEINGGRVGSSAVRLRHVPCKRKSHEVHIGQSSTDPDSHFRQDMMSGQSRAVPASFSSVRGVSLPHQAEPRLQQPPVIQVPGNVSGHLPSYSVQGSAEHLGRNSRLRIISSHPTPFSSAVSLRNSIVSTPQSSGFTPVNLPADSHSLSASSGVAAHRPLVVFNAPASTYTGHSSAPVFSGNVGSPTHNLASSGRNTRNDLGYPVFVMPTGLGPPIQNSVIRSTTDVTGALPGNAVYSSGSRSIPPAPPISQPSLPNMVPPIRHAQYLQIDSRRLSAEYVHQAMLAAYGPRTGGESSVASHGRGCPTPAQDTMLLTGPVNQGHRRSSSRSSQSTQRRADSAVGVPFSRHLASLGVERRRRLAELRNVMETMRRGQGLRLEDVMLLHQSAVLRVTDLHDRHSDLRLDVDNMSYEELLALEERIGNVSTGLNEETILNRLKQRKLVALADHEEVEPCCICREEYAIGEDIGTLDCGHEFHTGCIKQWLKLKNLCPICKTTGLAT